MSHLSWETTRLDRMTNTEESNRDLKLAVTSGIKIIFVVRKQLEVLVIILITTEQTSWVKGKKKYVNDN